MDLTNLSPVLTLKGLSEKKVPGIGVKVGSVSIYTDKLNIDVGFRDETRGRYLSVLV